MAIKQEGGGDTALMARPLREQLFFAASLTNEEEGEGGLQVVLVLKDYCIVDDQV